jgi:protein-L-isoaspartate O-methyltransferase
MLKMWITPIWNVLLLGILACSGCLHVPRSAPDLYACGYVETKPRRIQKLIGKEMAVLQLQPGQVVADIGTQNGYRMGMLSVLTDSLTIYLQDIDSTCLNKKEVAKVWGWYAWVRGEPLTNDYRIVLGDESGTGLPVATFDKIHVTATFHHFSNPERMLADLREKLKPQGRLYIIENVVKVTGETRKSLCNHRLRSEADLVSLFESNGFAVESVHELNRAYSKIFVLSPD